MIAGIGDPDPVLRIDGQVLRATELTRFATTSAPLHQELPVRREFLDAIVFTVFGDVVAAVRVLDGVGHEIEFARSVTGRAANRAIFQQFAQRRVDQHAKIVGVGDQQIALPIETQSGRLAVGDFRSPPTPQILAVPREDLNAARHVDDVELVAPSIAMARGFCNRPSEMPRRPHTSSGRPGGRASSGSAAHRARAAAG